jgi:hypothetical protein
MALPGKIASCLGVLEYWSVGKSESPNFNLNWSFHYSITPPLQQTAARGERALKPPQGATQSQGLPRRSLGEGGSFGPGFFTIDREELVSIRTRAEKTEEEICYEFDPTTLPRIRILQGSQIICLQM